MTAPDRIVIVNDTWDARGGASGLAMFLAEQLATDGWPVTFFSGMELPQDQPLSKQVNFVSGHSQTSLASQKISSLANGLWNGKVRRNLATWIGQNDTPATIYHVHSWSKILSPAVFAALNSVAPQRVVIHAHDSFLVCPNGGYFNYQTMEKCELVPGSRDCFRCHCDKRSRLQKRFRIVRHQLLHRQLERLQPTCHFLAIHPIIQQTLICGGISADQITIVRNPVHSLGVQVERPADNSEFLYIGQMSYEKGVQQLAAAATKANVPLRMLGTGSLEQPLREQFPQLNIDGWSNRQQIRERLQQARCLVLPTLVREAFGLVLTEALDAGVPVVVSENCNLAPELEQLQVGVSVPAGNIERLADTLQALSKDDELISRMSRKAYAAATQLGLTEYEWISEITKVYQQMLETSSP